MNKKIAITCGDYNGIGPEVITKALNKLNLPTEKVVIVGSKLLLSELSNDYEFLDVPFNSSSWVYGKETKEAGEFAYQCLVNACELAKKGLISAIVTAPVSKNSMHLAGRYFSGQTEVLEMFLNDSSCPAKAEMLFVTNDLRVLLLTRHIALKDVKITKKLLIDKIERINNVLVKNYGITKPKIAVCSLNPHAGENGVLGDDELREFVPAINFLREKGIDVSDPMPSDTLFVKAAKAYLNNLPQPYDVYCACYHDQGLIPVKVLAMENAVNTTVGLSVIRTSPAHGTAYDIAGKGIADETSMVCAIKAVL